MKTILLVDDDKQLRFVLGAALVRKGYRVIDATTGTEGLEMARRHLPDLILSDIHMPGGDGTTLLQNVRNEPELSSKQVVLMTGRPDLVTPRNGMEQGADDFLIKPIELDALLTCMEARFSRSAISWRIEDQTLARLRSSVPPNLPHEFFTPMAGIIGLVDILRSGSDLTTKEINDIYNDLNQSAHRLNRTLRNYLLILDLQAASPETLLGVLSRRQVEESITAGVNEAMRLNKRRGDLTVQVNDCAISVKPGDLSRIVEELIDNACKFSRQGTPVFIELEADGLLTIADQGRGLTSEEINRIGAFQQFDRKKQEQQGLGLGLVLVQKLAALCQAKFSLISQLGEGTQVQIAFPVTRSAAEN